MKLSKQIMTIVLVIALFAAFNLSMYHLLTRRLSNNFSGATQAQTSEVIFRTKMVLTYLQ